MRQHLHIYDKKVARTKDDPLDKQCMLRHEEEETGAVKGREMLKKIRVGGWGGGAKERSRFFFFSGPIGDRFKGCDVISSSLGPCWLVPLLRMAPRLRWKDG